jgi:hypothetical protein
MGNGGLNGVSDRLLTSIRTNAIWGDMLVEGNSRTLDFSEDNVRSKCYSKTTSFEPELMPCAPSKNDD